MVFLVIQKFKYPPAMHYNLHLMIIASISIDQPKGITGRSKHETPGPDPSVIWRVGLA